MINPSFPKSIIDVPKSPFNESTLFNPSILPTLQDVLSIQFEMN